MLKTPKDFEMCAVRPVGIKRPSKDLKEIRKTILDDHNYYRSVHRAPPVLMDEKLNASAQAHCEKMAREGKPSYSAELTAGKVGENVYFINGYNPDVTLCTGIWYEESRQYDFNAHTFSDATSHFTTLVWKGVRKIGVGVHFERKCAYVTVQYEPSSSLRNAKIISENIFPATTTNVRRVQHPLHIKDVRIMMLEDHNKYRAKHLSLPLSLCDKLNSVAQAYADKMATGAVAYGHSPEARATMYGENLCLSYGAYCDPLDATHEWYDEISLFDFKHPIYDPKTAHFTALVWKGTQRVGFGVAYTADKMYVVANYGPYCQGDYADNVAPAAF